MLYNKNYYLLEYSSSKAIGERDNGITSRRSCGLKDKFEPSTTSSLEL